MVEDRGTEVIATEPVKVDIRSVDAELSSLWTKAAEGGLPGVSSPVVRVLLSNLLVYAASDKEANEAIETINQIAADHPARVVIADAEPGEPHPELKADLSMLCSISEYGRRLCGEEVRVHTHGITSEALGSILPLLAPDLPIYIWTTGDLIANDEVLRELSHVADHWIIDSRKFRDWAASLKRLHHITLQHEFAVILHDLAWIALSDWREVIAQFFDPPSARKYISGIMNITINFKPAEQAKLPIEPVIMASWLIDRLGWQEPKIEKNRDGWKIRAKTNNHSVSITMAPQAEAKLPVNEVRIEADFYGNRGVFTAVVAERADEIVMESDAPNVPESRRTVRIEPQSLSASLRKALDASGRDILYDNVLSTISELM